MQFNDHIERMKNTPAYWETAARERFADEAASFSVMCLVAFALGCRVRITLEPLERR